LALAFTLNGSSKVPQLAFEFIVSVAVPNCTEAVKFIEALIGVAVALIGRFKAAAREAAKAIVDTAGFMARLQT